MLSHNEAYEFLSKLRSVFINITPYRPYGGIASAAVTKKNEKEVRYSSLQSLFRRSKRDGVVSKKL